MKRSVVECSVVRNCLPEFIVSESAMLHPCQKPESQFTPIPDDPCKWPESISDAQRCDIVKRGPHELIMNFPYNNTTPRRRFSSNHYKRVFPNGESVSRSWLVYSGEFRSQFFAFVVSYLEKH